MERIYKKKFTTFLLLLPALLLFVGIIIVPIVMSFYYSLFDWNGFTDMKFIGLENYIELFTSKAVNFPRSISNSVVLAVLSVFLQIPLSLGLALLLAKGRRGEKVFLAIFFIPVVMSSVVIGQLWLKIYNPDYGILNVALRAIGRPEWTRVWLGERDVALGAAFVPIMWQYVGYHMLLLYAGVKSVPADVREAAMIDGATEGQVNWHIIIPMIKPMLRVSLIFCVTGSLKAFDLIYILTNGGPAHATEVPSTQLLDMLFLRNRYGLGSAIAVLLVAMCFIFAIVIRKAIKSETD